MDKSSALWSAIVVGVVASYFFTGVPGGATEACVSRLRFMARDPYCERAIKMDTDSQGQSFMEVRATYLEQDTTRGQGQLRLERAARQQEEWYSEERSERNRRKFDALREGMERETQRQQEVYDRMNQQLEDNQRRTDSFMRR